MCIFIFLFILRHKDVFEELEHKIIKTQPIKLIKVEHLDEHGEKFFEEVDFDPAQYEVTIFLSIEKNCLF